MGFRQEVGEDGVVRTYKDVGPLELYSRLTVGTEGKEVRCFNYGLKEVVPGTDRVATLTDTNLPYKRHLYDDSIAAIDLSWHITLPPPEHLVEVQKLMDKGSWEFHIGGEKPFYQGLFCTTALSGMYVLRAYPIVLPMALKLNHHRDNPLIESALFYIEVQPPKLTIPIDVVFRIGCTRSRGVA